MGKQSRHCSLTVSEVKADIEHLILLALWKLLNTIITLSAYSKIPTKDDVAKSY